MYDAGSNKENNIECVEKLVGGEVPSSSASKTLRICSVLLEEHFQVVTWAQNNDETGAVDDDDQRECGCCYFAALMLLNERAVL